MSHLLQKLYNVYTSICTSFRQQRIKCNIRSSSTDTSTNNLTIKTELFKLIEGSIHFSTCVHANTHTHAFPEYFIFYEESVMFYSASVQDCGLFLLILVLCTLCHQFLWIVHFFITPSVFSTVYLCSMLYLTIHIASLPCHHLL